MVTKNYRVTRANSIYGGDGKPLEVGTVIPVEGDVDPTLVASLEPVGKAETAADTEGKGGKGGKGKKAEAGLPGLPGLPGGEAPTIEALRDEAKSLGIEFTFNSTAEELTAAIAEKKAA